MRRVSVVGSTGSGKTVLAARLAEVLGVAHVELDTLHWQPGWTSAESGPFRRDVAAALDQDGWVVDGNYSQVQDLVWGQADTVAWLRYSLPTMGWRLTKRTWRRVVRSEELWNENRESLRNTLSRDSLYLWLAGSYRDHRRRYPALFASPEWSHLRTIELRSPGQATALLELLEMAPDALG